MPAQPAVRCLVPRYRVRPPVEPIRHLLPATDRLGQWNVRRMSWWQRMRGRRCSVCVQEANHAHRHRDIAPTPRPARYLLTKRDDMPRAVCTGHLYSPVFRAPLGCGC